MKEALGLKSKSGVHRLITGLEERGFIKRLPHRARALDVVRLPEDQTAKAARPAAGDDRRASLNVIRGDFTPSLPGAVVAAQPSNALQLPLYGKIAAGTPIEALRDTQTIEVPPGLLGRGEHYALEVEGDSMIEAGIVDGDTVIIEKCENAENGTIIVAFIDEDKEVTLKRLRRRGNSIALEPANKKYETRIFRPDQVKVQGRLVGLLRRF
jgi:repressor LexA